MSTSDNTQALLTLMQTLGVDPAEVLALMTSGNAGGATPSVSVNDFVNNSGQTQISGFGKRHSFVPAALRVNESTDTLRVAKPISPVLHAPMTAQPMTQGAELR